MHYIIMLEFGKVTRDVVGPFQRDDEMRGASQRWYKTGNTYNTILGTILVDKKYIIIILLNFF